MGGAVFYEKVTAARDASFKDTLHAAVSFIKSFLFYRHATSSTASGPPSPQGEGILAGALHGKYTYLHCCAMLPQCLPQEGISCPEGVFHAAARQYFMPTNGRYFILIPTISYTKLIQIHQQTGRKK